METQNKQHPPELHLAALAFGKLKADVASKVQLHLSDCDECRRYVAETPRDELAEVIRLAKSKRPTDQNTLATGLSGTVAGLQTSPLGPSPPDNGQPTPAGSPPSSTSNAVQHAVGENEIPRDLYAQSKYRIIRVLGRGGMGTVYEAEHVRMKRRVAIKVINPELVNHPQALLRFEEEIRAVASLDHTNIARAFDAENIGSLQVFVMEFVRGQTLYEFLKSRGRLTAIDGCRCVRQALIGLQHAHQQGLVHRDLKPQNLMLTRDTGQIKILDFGLAKAVSENRQSRGLTGSQATMGTYAYMAPEQALDAASADIRADIYSLGCTLYYLIGGVLPFDYETDAKLLLAHQNEVPCLLHEFRTDVPEALSALVARMLAKNPADRPQTPKEAADALLPFARGDVNLSPAMFADPSARPATKHRGIDRWKWRGIAAALLALFGFGGWAAGLFSVRTPHGTIVVENAPADADVSIDGNCVTVTRNRDSLVIEAVERGPHHLKLLQSGREIWSDDVTISMAGQLLAVKFLPKESSPTLKSTNPSTLPDAKHPPTASDLNPAAISRAPLQRHGDWRIDKGELLIAAEEKSFIRFGDPNWTDFDFSFKVCRVNGTAVMGCYFRHDLSGNWRYFAMGTNNGNSGGMRTGAKTVGKRVGWWDLPGHPIELGHWYDVQITCRGTEFRTSVDGKEIKRSTRNDIKKGAVGFLANGKGTVRFKDVKVTAPDGTSLWKDLPDVSAPAQMPDGLDTDDDLSEPPAESHVAETDSSEADASPTRVSEDGFISLFNGDDTTGWKTHPSLPGPWSVENGVLRGGAALSQLYSERDNYENVHVRVKFRFSAVGRFGLYVRGGNAPKYGGQFPEGLEVICNSEGMPNTPNTGVLWLKSEKKQVFGNRPAPLNEQVQLDVIIQGDHASVSVDGQPMPPFVDSEHVLSSRGHIILQTQSSKLAIESVEVKELAESGLTEQTRLQNKPASPGKQTDIATLFPPGSCWVGTRTRDTGTIPASAVVTNVNGDTVVLDLGLRLLTCKVANERVRVSRDEPKNAGRVRGGFVTSSVDVNGKVANGKLTIEGTEVYRTVKGPARKHRVNYTLTRVEGPPPTDEIADAIRAYARDGAYNRIAGLLPRAEANVVGEVIDRAIADHAKPISEPFSGLVRGELCIVGDRADLAEAMIRAAIQAGGSDDFYFKSLGWSLSVQGKKDEARQEFQKALSRYRANDGTYDWASANPDPLTAAYFLDLLSEPKYIELLATHKQGPTYSWFYVGQRREIERKPDEAIVAYKRSIEFADKDEPHSVSAFARWRLAVLDEEGAESDEPAPSGATSETPAQESNAKPASIDSNAGFVPLFNGKDLTGWSPDAQGVWTVHDGVLTGRGSAISFLFTDRADFENLHVRVKARINDGGNSGILVRWLGPGEAAGYEAQIDSTARDPNRTGTIYRWTDARAKTTEPPPPPDKWFVEEIIARGNHVTVLVDGKQTAVYDDPEHVPRGRIALQMHDGQTVVEFKSIEVKELPDSPSPVVATPPSSAPPKPAARKLPAKNTKKKSRK